MNEISFFVPGDPQTQGSKSGFAIRRKGPGGQWVYTGKVAMVEGRRPASRAAFTAWRESVKIEAHNARVRTGWITADEPMEIVLTFWLARPKKPAFNLPATGLDYDKLARAVGDSLTDAGLYVNDARVCDATIRKRWVDDENRAGVLVVLRRINAELL